MSITFSERSYSMKELTRSKRGISPTSILALVALGIICLTFTGLLVWQRLGAQPVSQREIEQRAIDLIRRSYPGTVHRLTIRATTLEQAIGSPASVHICSRLEWAENALWSLFTFEALNPCDLQALVWVVDARGVFSCSLGTCDRVHILYLPNGRLVRSTGLP